MLYQEYFLTKRCATDALQRILYNKDVCYWCLTMITLEDLGVSLISSNEDLYWTVVASLRSYGVA